MSPSRTAEAGFGCRRVACLPSSAAVLLAVGMAGTTPVLAGSWKLGSSVSLVETYTDNIGLVETGAESRFFTQVVPRVTLSREGGRAKVNLSASVRYDTAGGGSGSLTPRLNGTAKVELIRQRLFVDANARISRTAINPYGPIGVDDLNRTGNATTTYQLGVSPYYKDRLRDLGEMELRYRVNSTRHSGGSARNSLSQSVDFSLRSLPGPPLSWGLRARYRHSGNSGSSNTDLASSDLTLGYRFDRKWSVDASAGREWNDYATTRTRKDGFRWTLNTTWTPNSRTRVRIGYGDRFFGSTPSLDVQYRHRRSTLKASYRKTVTDANTTLNTIGIDPVTGDLFPVAILQNDVFVDERFTGSYTLKGKRTTLNLSVTHSSQTYENSPQSSELAKYGVSLTRTLPGKTRLSASLNWYQQDRSASSKADTLQVLLGINHPIAAKTSLGLRYSFNRRDDDNPGSSYDENRVALTLSHTIK